MKKIGKKILQILTISVTAILLFIVLTLLISKFTGKVPSFFGYSYMKVISGSMEPEIPVNSFIIVKRINASNIKVNDIISFYSRDPGILGKPNTHRVVDIENISGKIYFTTRGEANFKNDDLKVSEDDVIGVYEGKADFFSAAGKLLSNPFVYFLLIFLPALVLFIFEVKNFINKIKEVRLEEKEAHKKELLKEEIERLKQSGEEK